MSAGVNVARMAGCGLVLLLLVAGQANACDNCTVDLAFSTDDTLEKAGNVSVAHTLAGQDLGPVLEKATPLVENASDDAAAVAQVASDGATTLVEEAQENPDPMLEDLDALKNEAVWTAADVGIEAYHEGMQHWPGDIAIQGVGGGGNPDPPIDPDNLFATRHELPKDHVDPPEPPPANRTIEDTAEAVAGPGGKDAAIGAQAAIGDAEQEATDQTSRQAESSNAVPGRVQDDAPPPDSEAPPREGEGPPLKPSTVEESIPVFMPGLGTTVVAAMATVALGAWLLARSRWVGRVIAGLPIAGLFSRQTGQDVLKHPARARIHGVISEHTGITSTQLKALTGMQASSLRYHLEVLQREDLVRVAREGKILHFHVAGADPRTKATQCLFRRRRGVLAKTILGKPGASQQHLAHDTGIAPSLVCTYVRDLTRGGLVRAQRMGRYQRYFPTQLLEGIQEKGLIPEA